MSERYTPTVRDIAGVAYEQAVEARRWTHEKNIRAWTTMKSRKRFRVPLSGQALDVLRIAKALNPHSDLVFPNERGNPFSDSAYSKLFRELEIPATPNGFRSSFSEWAHGLKGSDFAVVEYSLAHVVGSKVTRAYLRTDYLEERRELMQKWGEFVGGLTIFGVDAVDFTGGEKSRQSRESG